MRSSRQLLASAEDDEQRAWSSESPRLAEYLEARAKWKRFLAREKAMDETLTHELEEAK